MKKLYVLFAALCILGFTDFAHARDKSTSHSKSKLRHLNKIHINSTKTIRGFTDIKVSPESTGKVYINKINDHKHEVTGMADGVVILLFTDEDGNIEDKAITIQERPEPQANVSFGFGWGTPYYYSSDPFYSPYWGWGSNWNWNPYWVGSWGTRRHYYHRRHHH